jgi:DNA-binding NtrC family response regulator
MKRCRSKRALVLVEPGERSGADVVAERCTATQATVALTTSSAAACQRSAARKLARLLEEDGHRVVVALSARAALRVLMRPAPLDVLVVDVSRRQTEALAVANYGRSLRADLPVIFITNYPQELVSRSKLEPAPILFTKPLDYETLCRAIEALPAAAAV